MRSEAFWQYFDNEAAPKLLYRAASFRKMFEHLDSFDRPVVIVETGCVRLADNWGGDGQSTILFDRYLAGRPESSVDSIDLSPEATTLCKALVSDRVTIHTGDSVVVLRAIAKRLRERDVRVDLLYLDSYDINLLESVHADTPSALHHLKELISIGGALGRDTLVAVDDSPATARLVTTGEGYGLFGEAKIGGKGTFVAEYAKQAGATLCFSGYQVGWTNMAE